MVEGRQSERFDGRTATVARQAWGACPSTAAPAAPGMAPSPCAREEEDHLARRNVKYNDRTRKSCEATAKLTERQDGGCQAHTPWQLSTTRAWAARVRLLSTVNGPPPPPPPSTSALPRVVAALGMASVTLQSAQALGCGRVLRKNAEAMHHSHDYTAPPSRKGPAGIQCTAL
eukprot:364606-Chlamydomonas_euryale.AAC.2